MNVRRDAVGSVLPAGSTARTAKVCCARLRVPVVWPDLHHLQVPASRRHRKVEPAWEAVNLNVGVRSRVVAPGEDVIVVPGGRGAGGPGVHGDRAGRRAQVRAPALVDRAHA